MSRPCESDPRIECHPSNIDNYTSKAVGFVKLHLLGSSPMGGGSANGIAIAGDSNPAWVGNDRYPKVAKCFPTPLRLPSGAVTASHEGGVAFALCEQEAW